MSNRYFFHISYNGFDYRGWQRQKQAISIQQIIEEALFKILRKEISILGCGRTDAQVHAQQYYFHLNYDGILDRKRHYQLNQVLPKAIVIHDILEMHYKAHARFDAMERSYQYLIHRHKNPFLNEYSAYYPIHDLDFGIIQKALKIVTEYQDMRSFCKTADRYNNTLVHWKEAKIELLEGGQFVKFHFTANRFIKSLIRILVANLLEVGQGKLSIKEFENYLKTKTQPKQMIFAYPQGLYLAKIKYPYLNINPVNLIAF